jgi:putative hydrolase of the HAD superfamily
MPIRNVMFDFGGVLIRWRPQEIIDTFYNDEALRALLKTQVFQHPDWLEMDRGMLGEDEAARRFAARMGRPVEELTAFMKHVKTHLTPVSETVEVLLELSRAGVPLYGLSNMPAFMFDYLRTRDEHWSVFRGIVISGEVKMVKPEARIFEHIARLHSLTPEETVFIDDLKANIEAAKRLRFETILFESPSQCGAEIKRLLSA